MTTYRTGADAEHLAALRLRRLGYVVHLAGYRPEVRDGKRVPYGADLFIVTDTRGKPRGLFDLVAVSEQRTRWVQVKNVRSLAKPPAWWCQAVEGLPAAPATSYECWLLTQEPARWAWWRWKGQGWQHGEEVIAEDVAGDERC